MTGDDALNAIDRDIGSWTGNFDEEEDGLGEAVIRKRKSTWPITSKKQIDIPDKDWK